MKCTCLTSSDHPSMKHMDHCAWAREEQGGTVLAFRNEVGQPVVVPHEVAAAGERPYRAHQLLLQGYSWQQIAQAEGYADAAAARFDVERYKKEGERLVELATRQQQLVLEVSRLDALQSVVWPQAMKGHLPAVKTVMDLIMSRAKLMGVHTLSETDEIDEATRTVIIEGEDYAGALTRLADQS